MDQAEKPSLFDRILQVLRGKAQNKHSISESLKRIDDAEKRIEDMEQVTMTWTVDQLTENEKRELGF